MGFPGNGTQGHAACAEPLHDVLCRFHLVQVNLGAHRLQSKSIPQHCHGRIVLVVLIRLIGFLHRHNNNSNDSENNNNNGDDDYDIKPQY